MAIVLEELGIKYETKFLDMATEMKAKPFTDKNPNGRLEHFSQIPECHVLSDRLGLVLGLVTATWLAWTMLQLPLQCTKASSSPFLQEDSIGASPRKRKP